MIGVLLFVLFIVVPIAELAVIIMVGDAIGVLPTILALVVSGIVGAALAKREGTAVWARFKDTMRRGQVPSDEIVDGFLVLLGGALLLTPGFLTDALGLVLLFPLTRKGFKRLALRAGKALLFVRFPKAGVVYSRFPGKPARPRVKVTKVTRTDRSEPSRRDRDDLSGDLPGGEPQSGP